MAAVRRSVPARTICGGAAMPGFVWERGRNCLQNRVWSPRPDEEGAMAIFPKIQSPCPYKGNLSDIMDGETCRLCEREVFDLTHMTDGDRVAFMKGCSGEVCVSYRIPVMAAAVAAIAIATPMAAAACEATNDTVVVTGGIKDPAHTQFVENVGDKAIPVLPVVYEKSAKPLVEIAAPSDSQSASR
jgi:hypothetical protein